MRISPPLGYTHFHHNPEEVRPLKDIFDAFHGQYLCTKTHFRLDQFTYRTDDGLVIGTSIPVGGAVVDSSVTQLQIDDLDLRQQAARWTAVEAYSHLYYERYETKSLLKGFRQRPLSLVAPDQRGILEWGGRKDPDFAVKLVLEEGDSKDDREVSLFQARGDTLLSAAQTMVKYYGDLSSSTDLDTSLRELDASMTIAQALGSTSMEHLEEIWEQAIAKPTPKAAACHAYRNLMTE